MTLEKPQQKPGNPRFSSGPCAKRPGWTVETLTDAVAGRSHRSKPGKAALKAVIDAHRSLLDIPDDYLVGIVPASDTGAVEMALWSLLGARPVDVLVWESFSKAWATDIVDQLKLDNARVLTADYGQIADLSAVNPDHDYVFAWNGTTSGVCVPDGDWISDDRSGLTICDATSAVFAMDLPWDKLDVVTWSWQKVLGGEAAHGMLVLSPRAVERLESYSPDRPLPKIFRLTKGGKVNRAIFEGATINTPSMLAVADCTDALQWVESIGGKDAMIKRSTANLAVIEDWVARTDWVDFLAHDAAIRSSTSICLKVVDPTITALPADAQAAFAKALAARLDAEGVAYDIGAYRDAPPGLRLWGGGTVEADDLAALTHWLDWAFAAERDAVEV
ncbi:MAG: phosphoserine transaminase [Alphaproteobacteria bacterium]